MRKLFTLLLLFLFTLSAMASMDGKLRIAVFDPSTSGRSIDEGAKIAIREIISSTLVNTGLYDIVERSLLEKVMQEQSFSNSGAVDDSQMTEIGKLAGANKIVLTVASFTGGRCVVSIKIIDVMTASVDRQRVRIFELDKLFESIEPMTLSLVETALSVDYNLHADISSNSSIDESKSDVADNKVEVGEAEIVNTDVPIAEVPQPEVAEVLQLKKEQTSPIINTKDMVRYYDRGKGHLYVNGLEISEKQYMDMCMAVDGNLWLKYLEGSRRRTTGTWLMSAGGGLAILGTVLFVAGAFSDSNDYGLIHGLIISGCVFMPVGGVLTLTAGVPIYCIGKKNRRQSVEGYNAAYGKQKTAEATINFGISDAGVGFALSF